MTTLPTHTWEDGLVAFLRTLRDDKAAMADLRTGLRRRPEEATRLHRYVAGFVPDNLLGTAQERAVYTVAALFAAHPDLPVTDESIGEALRQLAAGGTFSADGVERRIQHLVRSSDSTALCRNLVAILALLAGGPVGLSWSRLADDIDHWDRDADRVIRRWLRDFYRTPAEAPSSPDATTEP